MSWFWKLRQFWRRDERQKGGADTHAVLSLVFTGIALFAPCDQSFYPSLWGVALPDGQGDVLIDDGGEIDGGVVTDGCDVEGEQRGKGLGEVEGDNGEGVGGKPACLQGKARSFWHSNLLCWQENSGSGNVVTAGLQARYRRSFRRPPSPVKT